jgi:feruloyl esterase
MIRNVAVMLVSMLGAAFADTPCERLKSLSLADTTIAAAEMVAGGLHQFTGPGRAAQQQSIQLPGHCRVAAVLRPSPDSHIELEVWLPTADWNGKYLAVGNGGWAGSISFSAMALALREGYATSSTDTGHKGGNAEFAPGHPEKVIDYAYRSVHEMTLKSKAIIAAFYGRAPRYSYWDGCSGGGRQGLMEAQRYPEDFDGIIAGAAANYKIHMNAWKMALQVALSKNPGSLVATAKRNVLNQAVLAACDALDGVKDGLLTDPLKCHFDPATLLCRERDTDNCLTAPQVEAVRMAYAEAKKKTGEVIFPGFPPGGETGWQMLADEGPIELELGTFRSVLYQDPKWDWHNFDLDRDTALAEEKVGYMDSGNPDLSAFKNRGGKLLMYHGWNDPAISALSSIKYYSSVLAQMGPDQENWYRMFLVPGMGHCRGGPGPDQFNALAALERWREADSAPEQIIAFHVANNRVEMTRPLCPYPQVAQYKGTGSTNDAVNFACTTR